MSRAAALARRRPGTPSPKRVTWRRRSWLDRTHVGGAPTSDAAATDASMIRRRGAGSQGGLQEVEVERLVQLVGRHVAGDLRGLRVEDLRPGHAPAGVRGEDLV